MAVQELVLNATSFCRSSRRLYNVACLALDPAVRLRQLERLTCAALAEQGVT